MTGMGLRCQLILACSVMAALAFDVERMVPAAPSRIRLAVSADGQIEDVGPTIRLGSGTADPASAKMGCLRDHEVRPTGSLGSPFPSTVFVQSVMNVKLRGAACGDQAADHVGGCGLLNYAKPWREHECVREVPKIIHFVWLDQALPQKYANNIRNVMAMNPQWAVKLWTNEGSLDVSALTNDLNDDEQKRLHVTNLKDVEHLFTNLDIIHMKQKGMGGGVAARADLLRLEVTYLDGGIYLDTDAIAHQPFDDYGRLFRWPFVSNDEGGYGNLCNCVFSAEKHSPFLKFAMESWRDIYLHHDYPIDAPYGCGAFTGAFIAYNNPEIMMLGMRYMMQNVSGTVPIMTQAFDGTWTHMAS